MSQKGVPPAPTLAVIHSGPKKVVFCYDIVCPYAYIASTLIEPLAAEYSAKVEFHPVLLSGLITLDAASRENDRPHVDTPAAKILYMRSSLMREAARHKVELRFPAHHPVRSVAAMRVLSAVEGAERVKLTHALYRAYWVEGRDISNESVLMDAIKQCGIKAVNLNSPTTPPYALRGLVAALGADSPLCAVLLCRGAW